MKYTSLIFLTTLLSFQFLSAQDATGLAKKVKAKLATVNDYQATGKMKTDVSFMKIPESEIIVYYKRPNQFRIKRQEGITVTPKGGVSINLNSLLAGDNYTAVYTGPGTINGIAVSIIKLLPLEENSEVVVSTLYINEKELLIYKATSTTKDNGTYEMEMTYGKYSNWGLPDKVTFVFNTKDYKLPKGLAFDYDTGSKPIEPNTPKNGKGKVEILYSAYTINKGIAEAVFK
ncbi:MAG: LolA family protein [Chitinophagaceae bacterium]